MKRALAPWAILEPSQRVRTLQKSGINIGSALTGTQLTTVLVPLVNTSDKEYLIRKGTTLAVMHPATNIQEWDDREAARGTTTVRAMGRETCESARETSESARETCESAHQICEETRETREKARASTLRPRVKEEDAPEHVRPLLKGISTEITPLQREELAAMLTEYQDVFSKGPDDMGCTDLVKHQIDTGDARPIRQPPRRLPIAKQAVEQVEVSKMLDRGVIEPSNSPWASPVVLVTKSDGSTRFCVDYRRLNDVTHKDAYPLPRIDDTLDALSGSAYFSTLDLYSGYWQVEMDPADREKTAFSTRMGLYQWRVMPFGLCNAPATF